MKRFLSILAIPFLLLQSSCVEEAFFEVHKPIPESSWQKEQRIDFEVEMSDTNQIYSVNLYIRHTEYYPWSNLWVMMHTTFPDGKESKKRIELELAEASGKWFGECSGDNCEIYLPIQAKARFNQMGTYRFGVEQIMRSDNLEGVLDVGLQLDEVSLDEGSEN